jgi:hypothetical protein
MADFSEDQMHRPLFEEPTDDIERVDAWEGPLGFLIGGMANMSLRQLGEQYFDAATLLTEIIQSHKWEDYRLANPTFFPLPPLNRTPVEGRYGRDSQEDT